MAFLMAPRPTPRPPSRSRFAVAAVVILFPTACSRTIDEEDPPTLVESRLEPCRARCEVQLHPECGARPEDHPFRTVDECVESCADIRGGWSWALQEDGTDACAEEWVAAADCIVALTCEEQHEYFTRIPVTDLVYPCQEETEAKMRCFRSTPSLEKIEED
jgi:hypothetical protein